jgi:hypothetical protein
LYSNLVRCTLSIPEALAGRIWPAIVKKIYLVFAVMKIYLNCGPSLAAWRELDMLKAIRQLHRVLVDQVAESRWLRGRAGANASWAHYERHARAWIRSGQRHAAARAAAKARAELLHARSRARAQRLARRGPPRVLKRYQAAIGRIVGSRNASERPGK